MANLCNLFENVEQKFFYVKSIETLWRDYCEEVLAKCDYNEEKAKKSKGISPQ